MKRNKNIKILIILLCIIMAVILGCLIYISIGINHSPSTNELENIQQNEPTTSTEPQNNVIENVEQQNIVEPILNEITNPQNNQTSQEVISSTYYYGQLDDNAKIIYDALKENKENMKTGTYELDFETQFNTLLHTETGEQELQRLFNQPGMLILMIKQIYFT